MQYITADVLHNARTVLLQEMEGLSSPGQNAQVSALNFANFLVVLSSNCIPTLYYVGMPVLCKYAITALFAYFLKVCMSHVFPHRLSLSLFPCVGFYLCEYANGV